MKRFRSRRLYLAMAGILLQALSLVCPWILVSQGGKTHSYNAFYFYSTSVAGITLCVIALGAALTESTRFKTWHYSAGVFSLALFISILLVCILEIGTSFSLKFLVPVALQRAWFAAGAGFGGWLYVLGSFLGLVASVSPSSRAGRMITSIRIQNLSSVERLGIASISLAAALAFICRYFNWFSVGGADSSVGFQGWVFPQIGQTSAYCAIGWLIAIVLVPKFHTAGSLLSIFVCWMALTSCALVLWAGLSLAQTASSLATKLDSAASTVSLDLGVWMALISSLFGVIGSTVIGLRGGSFESTTEEHLIKGSRSESYESRDFLV